MSAIMGLHLIWLLLKFIVCSCSQECVHVFAPPASVWALLVMMSIMLKFSYYLILLEDDYL